MYGNAADAVEYPAKDGCLPEGGLGDKGGVSDSGPHYGDVQKAHVVCHDNKARVLGNILCAFYLDFEAEQLEDDVLEIEGADVGDLVFAPADGALVNDVGRTQDDHPGENSQVEQYCTNKAHYFTFQSRVWPAASGTTPFTTAGTVHFSCTTSICCVVRGMP